MTSSRDSCCEEPQCDIGYNWEPKLIVKGKPTSPIDGTLPSKPTMPMDGRKPNMFTSEF